MSDDAGHFHDEELDDDTLQALAGAHATAPPPELRGRVLAAVHEHGQSEANLRHLNHWRSVGIAASAAAATLAVFLFYDAVTPPPADPTRVTLEFEKAELRARVEEQERDLRLLEEALSVHTEVVRILTARGSRSAELTAVDGGSGTARVLLDPESGAVAVLGKGLPPPKAGRVYELWAIRGDGTTEPAGVLEASGERSFAVRLRQVARPGEVREFAISIEPEGGADNPTGPLVLVGAVGP